MAKALTAAAIEKIKPSEARREIPDGLLTGLYFIVQPSGAKSWAVRYRLHGRLRKLTLGKYPVLDLAAARSNAKEALQAVQNGDDPALEKQAKLKAPESTFDRVLRDFLKRYAKPKNRSWLETARLLGLKPGDAKDEIDDPDKFKAVKGGLAAKWRDRDIKSFKRGEVIRELDAIIDRGAPTVANRTLAALRKLFNWAVSRDLLEANPCAGVKAPTAEVSRDRVLSEEELCAFLDACRSLNDPMRTLFLVLLLTGQRREEVAGMTWGEIDGDTWTIPRERAKNDKAHEVPLCEAVTETLGEVKRIESEKGFVFTTTGKTPVSGFSKAKARIDEGMLSYLRQRAEERGEDPETVTLPAWRTHDLRRTVASGMARLGINLPVIERVLNHVSGSFGGIVGVYQRHEFQDEKRAALEAWANYLESLVKPAENVFYLNGKASA